METVKQYMERKNLDDANLAEILKHIIAEAGLSVGDLFDDDEICDHIHEAGIPVDTLYDEDDILECGCVTDKIEELEQRLGELEDEKDYVERDHRDDLKRCDELMRQLAEFREWNAKMRDNGNEEWCRRCGSWQREEWSEQGGIVKDAKWGCVCEDCLHHLDNEDHERCEDCDCCKDCGCCECEEDELCEAIDASGNALY